MSQKRYTEEILKRFGMSDCKPVQTPADKNVNLVKSNYNTVNEFPYRQLVGSLIYLNATRPDISWIVSKLSQFLDNPSPSHVTAAKRVLRYLKGTESILEADFIDDDKSVIISTMPDGGGSATILQVNY